MAEDKTVKYTNKDNRLANFRLWAKTSVKGKKDGEDLREWMLRLTSAKYISGHSVIKHLSSEGSRQRTES